MGVRYKSAMQSYTKRLEDVKDEHMKKLASATQDFYTYLVESTPKDTSEAANSWDISYTNNTPRADKSLAAGKRASQEEKQAAAQAVSASQNARLSAFMTGFVAQYKKGLRFYITNGANHIRDLEHGTSNQQAAGWVALGLHKFKKDVE